MRIKTLIVDDEELARSEMRFLLKEQKEIVIAHSLDEPD